MRCVAWIAAVIALLAGAAYLEFAIDVRTPNSPGTMRSVIVTNNKLSQDYFERVRASLKAKFGETAEVWHGPAGIHARVNGAIVGTEPVRGRFHEAIGIRRLLQSPP
jgi:hypothetical protein